MNIGIMCHSSFGGSTRIAIELAKQLARRNHSLHLLTTHFPPFPIYHQQGEEIHIHSLSPERRENAAQLETEWQLVTQQKYLSQINEVIKNYKLDILHFHFALPFAFFAQKIRQSCDLNLPILVGTIHGTDITYLEKNHTLKNDLSQALQAVDGITTVSRNYAERSQRVFDLAESPRVIPNFIDMSEFETIKSSPQKSPLEISSKNRYKIIHISNFRPVKNVLTLVKAFEIITKKIDAELWLVGDGPDMEEVKSFLVNHHLENRVHYLGFQPNIVVFLKQADLLFMSSLEESFCLVALEAMACGVPVLATDVGGISEVVINHQTGLLFPVGDYDQAARFAIDLLSNKEQYLIMQSNAQKHAQKFSSELIVPLYEKFYQELMDLR